MASEPEAPVKRPRGNPQFQINKKLKEERLKNTPNTMADEKEPKKEVDESGKEVKEAPTPSTAQTASTDQKPIDTLPEDLFSDKMPGEENLPLDGVVKEKAYAALPDNTTESTASSNGAEKTSSDASASSTAATNSIPPPTPEEIKSQAEQTADLLIKGYEKLHSIGRWVGKVDQSELNQMHAKGKINLEQVLPLGKKSITVGGFFEEYNQGIDQNIVVDQEFKDKIKTPLVRECIRRNWLLNDMTYILVMVADDASTKIGMLIGLKKSANLVLNACQEMMKKQNEQSQPKKEPPPTTTENTTEENVDWREAEESPTN